MRLITEGDNLPPGWRLSTVADACRIRDELRFPISVELREEMQGEFPYYGPTGSLDYVNEYRVEGTFTLIGEDGDHFLKYTEWPMTQLVSGKFNVNNHAHLIEGTECCLTEWFFYFFHHVDLKPLLSLQGVGRYKLTRGALERLPIVLPPLAEQKAIAGVLSAWDRAIEQTTALIAAKQRLKQGLMQQLLTGQRRFPEFNDNWRTVRVGDIGEEVSIRNGADESTPVLSCTKHAGLVNSLEYFGKRVFSENIENYKVVKRGEFAYATNHIEEGSIGLLSSVPAGLVSPMYTVFRTTDDVLPEFLYRVLKTEHYRQIFESFTSASVDRRGSLRWKQFATIPLHLPNHREQKRLVELFDDFDSHLGQLKAQLETTKKQKRGLMQKLLTGEVRVSHKLLKQGAKS